MSLDFLQIEQAMKDLMAAQVESKAWPWVREIKTYGGEFDDDITAIIKHFPAIWVTFAGSRKAVQSSYDKTEYHVNFAVLVGARSMRNEEAQRHGAGREIGAYQMLIHVQNLLTNNSLGLKGLAPLSLGTTKTIFNTKTRDQSLSVFSQEFSTSYTIHASDRKREEDATEAYLERVFVDYFYDDPAASIAQDQVELKQG